MTAPVTLSDAQSLSHAFDEAAAGDDPRACDAIAVWLRELVDRGLFLPAPAPSYREDCLQELTFGLYELLRGWHADGRLAELRSLRAFVRHYVRWHAPSAIARIAFRLSAARGAEYPLGEQLLPPGATFAEMPTRRADSGCHQVVDARRAGDTAVQQIHHAISVAALSRVDRRIVQLAEAGASGRRQIEMCLVAEFRLSHRQARRAVDGLPARLRA